MALFLYLVRQKYGFVVLRHKLTKDVYNIMISSTTKERLEREYEKTK